MLMEFDLADWPQGDKEWVKQRKLQWKALEPQLRALFPQRVGELKL